MLPCKACVKYERVVMVYKVVRYLYTLGIVCPVTGKLRSGFISDPTEGINMQAYHLWRGNI